MWCWWPMSPTTGAYRRSCASSQPVVVAWRIGFHLSKLVIKCADELVRILGYPSPYLRRGQLIVLVGGSFPTDAVGRKLSCEVLLMNSCGKICTNFKKVYICVSVFDCWASQRSIAHRWSWRGIRLFERCQLFRFSFLTRYFREIALKVFFF